MMENVKIVSESSQPFMYHSPFKDEPEPMVRADKIADFIKRHTNVCRKYLIYPDGNRYYLDDDNIVKYSFVSDIEYGDRTGMMFTETVEKISNQGDEDCFMSLCYPYQFLPHLNHCIGIEFTVLEKIVAGSLLIFW